MNDSITWLAAGGVVAACWRQLLGFAQRIRSFFIVRTTLTGDIAAAMTAYCWKHFRRPPLGDRFFTSSTQFVRPMDRVQEVAWEKPPTLPILFLDGWRPLWYGGMSLLPRETSMPDGGMAELRTLRWFTDVERVLTAALDEHNARKSAKDSPRYAVYRCEGRANRTYAGDSPVRGGYPTDTNSPEAGAKFLKWKAEDVGARTTDDPMKALAIEPELEPCVQEFRQWRTSERWFKDRSIPWRRGWLLHGKPGTGKTSLVRALAQQENMPVFVFDIATLSNDEMAERWRSMQESAPCIALIEDVDSVFEGRKNILGESGGGLTFDCLLNCLSGIETCDGVFTVVTTNHIEKIDPALGSADGMSSRPGRLDRAIELPPMSEASRLKIANRIVGEWPDAVDSVMRGSEGMTPAQFTETCVQEALKRYWRNHL